MQNVYLGSTTVFDFIVSDYDDPNLYAKTETCPSFANNLVSLGSFKSTNPQAYSSYKYRLTISPPLTPVSLVGTHNCKISLDDTYDIVYNTSKLRP